MRSRRVGGLTASALDTATAASLHEVLDFRDSYAVVVANDRMLEARCGGGELERLLRVFQHQQTVNQSARKRVAGTNPVDDVGDLIMTAVVEMGAVMQYRRPAVYISAATFAQRDHL